MDPREKKPTVLIVPPGLPKDRLVQIAASTPTPKQVSPYCKICGWRKGGVDSWNGRACKCGHSEPIIQPIGQEK
jgi:hypothetical protein